jgi:hypothetical protein
MFFTVCPAARQFDTTPGLCSAPIDFPWPTVSDNCECGSIVQFQGPLNNSVTGAGAHSIGFSVSDLTNLDANCTFEITVDDVEPPTLTCPTPVTMSSPANACGSPAPLVPTFNDNCPNAAVSVAGNLATYPVGVTQVNFTVTDAALNILACSTSVTVNDVTPPTICTLSFFSLHWRIVE